MENPQAVEEVPMRSEKVMVWCSMHNIKIIGPYFFRRSSVDSAAYKSMLRYYGLQHVQQLPDSQILQQYGAPVHTSNTVKNACQENLAIIGLAGGPIDWPERSPDLTPLYFFLWVHVKDKVYSERIESLEHLNTKIRQAISIIDNATLSNVWKNINTGIYYVVRQEGKLIEQINFKVKLNDLS